MDPARVSAALVRLGGVLLTPCSAELSGAGNGFQEIYQSDRFANYSPPGTLSTLIGETLQMRKTTKARHTLRQRKIAKLLERKGVRAAFPRELSRRGVSSELTDMLAYYWAIAHAN